MNEETNIQNSLINIRLLNGHLNRNQVSQFNRA
jgi:hypothetical protein